ncbi:hypothetical protein BDM02DRAFT_3115457 [Thelephora ganbajun]|uniref:Uncharacterized protein n=1 Tax=Thelephora ganbajun TaxID=370292 RepID=A0ACB6ZG57_THEGA|nr:hypothetical protein BDM02DRAFT_3115457 [Thelephora ganbajun]
MSSHTNVNDSSNPTAGSLNQRNRALRRQESMLLIEPMPAIHRTINVKQQNITQEHVKPTLGVPLEKVERHKDLWFEDGDVIIWAEDQDASLLFRVHRRVLKESEAEPFCTVVNCDYPNPETSGEMFLNGVWVLKYHEQDPIDIVLVLKWMYERPSISKRSTIPFIALKTYLERSDECFSPPMRRCALEYLWNMLPTSLNYHQRVPTLVGDCYSENPLLFYKPYVLLTLIFLSAQHQLVAILPLLYYYIAQWPVDWITDGVPAAYMEWNNPSPDDSRFPLPRKHIIIVLAGRERLIHMRETKVFNFMDDFTSNGTTLDIPTQGCDGAKRQETGETCFEWLMRVWFFMSRFRFIARPSALEIMNMGQWAELKGNCCEACANRVMVHMLEGRDDVWKALPSAFGYHNWDFVVERQKCVEKDFEAEIC